MARALRHYEERRFGPSALKKAETRRAQPVRRPSPKRVKPKKPKLPWNGVIIKDRVYIPTSLTSVARLEKHFKYEFEIKKNGQQGGFETEVVRLWTEETIGDKPYYAVPVGNPTKIRQGLGVDLKAAKDRRSDVLLDIDLQWTGDLYHGQIVDGNKTTNQVKLTRKWLKKKRGVIEAKPRSGKTVMATFITCQMGRRTIIVADQEDLLRNFLKDFHKYTNIKHLEAVHGRQLIGIVRTMRDLDRFEIALVTYQKFIRESGDERMRKHILNKFGLAVYDEIHGGGATGFARVLNRFDTRYRLGLTATPARKDGRYTIVQDIVGPVTARSKSVSLVPQIEIIETGLGPQRGYKHWTYAMKWLSENKIRNQLIVKNVFKDLRAGHKCILIPVERKEQMFELVNMINAQAKLNRTKKNEPESMWPKQTALEFWAKSPRKETLDKIDSGKVRVVVAIRKLIRQGVNVLLPSMMHVVVPVSAGKDQATGSPLFQQLSNRVCTPYLNKPQPVVRLYIDRMDQSVGCFRSLFSKEILPRLRDKPKVPASYKMGRTSYQRAVNILKDGTRSYRYTASKDTKTPASTALRW